MALGPIILYDIGLWGFEKRRFINTNKLINGGK